MKKAALVFITFLMFLFTGGFSFAVSFCPMSEEWSLSFFSDKACSCEDEEEDCCDQNVIKLKKIEDNFFPSFSLKSPIAKDIANIKISSHFNVIEENLKLNYYRVIPEEPPPNSTSLFIFIRTIII